MTAIPQRTFSSFLWRWAFLFFTLYVVTLTFDYYLFQQIFEWISVPFRWLAEFTGQLFFDVNLRGADKFYSDSMIVYVHLFNIAMISLIAASGWTILSKPSTTLSLTRFTDTKFYPLLLTLLRYFVAFNLLVYGFSKLYKWQFMLPEPNLLYTTVGDMHRDILYWTSMGSSRSYSIFMGVIEIVPAILLLFRKTTLAGALLAVMVFLNVVSVNFGFDITVKLHSMTLLLMSFVILIPARKRIVALFTGRAADEWSYPTLQITPSKKWFSPLIKIAVILLLVMEAHYPYTITGTFNDDAAERPPMHGAYEVILSLHPETDSAGKKEMITMQLPLHRIFVNRRGYIIFQDYDGTMKDFPLTIDTTNHQFNFGEHYVMNYELLSDSTFYFTDAVTETVYKVKQVDLKKLPLLEEEFTWIDED